MAVKNDLNLKTKINRVPPEGRTAKPQDTTLMRPAAVPESNKGAVSSHEKRPRWNRDRALEEAKSMQQSELSDYQSDEYECQWCDYTNDTKRGRATHYSQKHAEVLPWRDEDVLRELYIDQRLPLHTIAERLGCSRYAVRDNLVDNGMSTRNPGEAQQVFESRRPASFRTRHDGYEVSYSNFEEKYDSVRIHRLAAVAWFGLEAVKDNHIHHKKPIPWLNAEWNLEPKDPSSHVSGHMSARVDKMVFDEDGNISGWRR